MHVTAPGRGDQRHVVGHWTARDIDDANTPLGRNERTLVQHVAGVSVERAVQDQEVRALKSLRPGPDLHVAVGLHQHGIVGRHPYVGGEQAPRDVAADTAVSDQGDGLVRQRMPDGFGQPF